MDYFSAIALGFVEGLTEFLPVSSTGHLILFSELLGLEQTEFHKTFEVVIQFGAILAVVVSYWRSFLDMEVLKRLLVAFVPTGMVGLALYPLIKGVLIGNAQVVVWALLLGGAALILFEWLHKERGGEDEIASISYKQAALVGVFQSIAIVPGVSRAAATILGGLLVGLRRTTIVQFSFLLAVPTMAVASGYDLLKTAGSFSTDEFGFIAAGFVSSFVVAMLAMRLLLSYVRKYSFVPFGVYRIAVAGLFLLFIL